MKKYLVLIAICVCFIGYSQEILQGKVSYRVSMRKTELSKLNDGKKITKERKEKLKKIINLSKDVVAELCFNNTESLYVIKGKMKSDADKKMNFTEIFAGGSNKYYVNLEIKEFFYETDTFGEVINIEMLQKKWKLTQETKKIGDYICYKAIDMDSKNQTTIAWYAPKIPVNYGPKKYFGLPGLILRVEESSFIFESTKIFLNKELKK